MESLKAYWIQQLKKKKLKERNVSLQSQPYIAKVSTGPPGKGELRLSTCQQPIQERIWTCEPPNPIPEVLVSVTLSSKSACMKTNTCKSSQATVRGGDCKAAFGHGREIPALMGIQSFPVRLGIVGKEQQQPLEHNHKRLRGLWTLPFQVDCTRYGQARARPLVHY